MNLMKQQEEAKQKENSIFKELREEIATLKKWKESAILETVDKVETSKNFFSSTLMPQQNKLVRLSQEDISSVCDNFM
jgi:hypothetical protein